MLRRAPSGDDDHNEIRQPRTRSKAVRRDHLHSAEDTNYDFDDMRNARPGNHKDVRLLPRKRRRVDAQRNIGLRPTASDEEVVTSSQESDSEWDTRPSQRKRRKTSLPRLARARATQVVIPQDRGSIGSIQAQVASPSLAQAPGGHQESVQALSARFADWLLETAVVRSAKVNGVTTFQLQFKADLYCAKHAQHALGTLAIRVWPQIATQATSPECQRCSTLSAQ